jgi:dephospho-CoA kinase
MLLVALTGGIGSGKSLAAEYFAACGAQVLDFDQLAREVVERGSGGFDEIVARFGDEVLYQGNLDRAKLAEVVFSDAIARKDLEAIIHPKIRAAFDGVVAELGEEAILVSQIPLLAESEYEYPFDFVVTVSAPIDTRRARLISRGMKEYQVSARIAAQATDEQREAIADAVLRNDGSEDDLLRQVENLYEDRLFPARLGMK